MRSFWFGSTSAKIVVRSAACHSASSRMSFRARPVRTSSTGSLTASPTCRATFWLSPVMILSRTPRFARSAIAFSTPGLGRSKNSRKPAKVRSLSSANE